MCVILLLLIFAFRNGQLTPLARLLSPRYPSPHVSRHLLGLRLMLQESGMKALLECYTLLSEFHRSLLSI